MVQIIKRGGFREQTARQLKYKDSVNQRKDISAQQTAHRAKVAQLDIEQVDVEKTASEKQSETSLVSETQTLQYPANEQ